MIKTARDLKDPQILNLLTAYQAENSETAD